MRILRFVAACAVGTVGLGILGVMLLSTAILVCLGRLLVWLGY